MTNFRNPTLVVTIALALASGPVFSAQAEDGPGKHSIIRVITTADGSGADSRSKTRVIELDGAGSSHTWVTGLPFKRGYLGVQLLDLTPELRVHFGVREDAGVMIAQVAEDSPAAAAGLEVGDILTAIENDPVRHGSEVSHRVSEYEDGQSVLLEVWRGRRAKTLTATITERERTAIDLGRLMQQRASGPGAAPVISRIIVRGKDGKKLVTGGGPTSEDIIEIDEAGLHEALRNFELRFESPDFVDKFRMLGRDREDLQQRILELEQRLKDLEKQLDKLSKE